MVKILICDDQVVVCEGLRAILSTTSEIEVLAVAYDGEQVIELAEKFQPDVILMDLKMPVLNGVQATRAIRTRFPNIHVLVLSTYDFDEWIFDAIRAGANGYLLKDTKRENLIAAILGTAEGKSYIDPTVAVKLLNKVSHTSVQPDLEITKLLSDRELDVFRLMGHGLTNSEIAAKLFLSEGTVRNYVSSIMTKLQVSDRTQAAILALRTGIATLDGVD